MKDYARGFYLSKQWQLCSKGYMTSKAYVCERCGGVAEICHHKKYITPQNITDPSITLNWDNLEALCRDCHNIEHMYKGSKVLFDDDGNIIKVKDSKSIREHKKARQEIDRLLDSFK